MASIGPAAVTCPLCSGNTCFPMVLKCGHGFCRVCLVQHRERTQSRVCPVCDPLSPSGKSPKALELKSASNVYHVWESSDGGGGEVVCPQHNKKLNLFCHNDEEVICAVCKATKQHKVHECSSVEEAAQQKKAEVEDGLKALTKKLTTLHKMKTNYEGTRAHIQAQGQEIEATLREEFEKLHQFLREEEERRLKQLRQEQDTKVEVMNRKLEPIQDQITALCSTIRDVEQALQAAGVTFLSEYKETKLRVKCPVSEPQSVRDILMDYSKHLGSLRFTIWKSLTDIVYDAPITLDPNTAHSNLKVSKDLSSVLFSRQQPLPDNPERFTSQLCVLGVPAFTSGKHRWTVDVGQGTKWCIGVVSESVKRKATVFLTPAEGFWVIGRCRGEALWAESTPRIKLTPKQMPQRVTVELDYDKGKVLFTDAADSSSLHVFKSKFTEKVFPYFSPGLVEDGEKPSPLTVRPVVVKTERVVSVGAEKHKKPFSLHTD